MHGTQNKCRDYTRRVMEQSFIVTVLLASPWKITAQVGRGWSLLLVWIVRFHTHPARCGRFKLHVAVNDSLQWIDTRYPSGADALSNSLG